MTRTKKVAIAAACAACIGAEEGVRTYVYEDPVGIPTYCFGETRDARPGATYTLEQCKKLLADRLERDFIPAVERCAQPPIGDSRKVAYVSLAYNIGVDAFCRSSVVRKHNAGDLVGACDAILLYTKARGLELPGLVKRRHQERELCMRGML